MSSACHSAPAAEPRAPADLAPLRRRGGTPPRPSLRSAEERDRLAEANGGLVGMVLARYRFRPTAGLDWEDVFQSGYLGLLRAAELYDPARGYAFSTYAVQWIRSAVHKAIHGGDLIHIPHHVVGAERLDLAAKLHAVPILAGSGDPDGGTGTDPVDTRFGDPADLAEGTETAGLVREAIDGAGLTAAEKEALDAGRGGVSWYVRKRAKRKARAALEAKGIGPEG